MASNSTRSISLSAVAMCSWKIMICCCQRKSAASYEDQGAVAVPEAGRPCLAWCSAGRGASSAQRDRIAAGELNSRDRPMGQHTYLSTAEARDDHL